MDNSQDILNLDRNARYRSRAVAVHDVIEMGRDITYSMARADWLEVQRIALSIARQAELLQHDPNLQLCPFTGEKQLTRIEVETQLDLRDELEGGDIDGNPV